MHAAPNRAACATQAVIYKPTTNCGATDLVVITGFGDGRHPLRGIPDLLPRH
jgi:hypothetical protein